MNKINAQKFFPGRHLLFEVMAVQALLAGVVSAGQPAANLLENGSFELGLHNNWSHPYFDQTPLSVTDDTTATQGKRSLKLKCSTYNRRAVTIMKYKPVKAEEGDVFTFAADFKADGEKAKVNRLAISSDWHRISFKVPQKDGMAVLALDLSGAEHFWIDGATLSCGAEPLDFTPAAQVEMGLYSEIPGNIFSENEPVLIHLQAVSYGKNVNIKPELAIMDYFGKRVLSKTPDISLAKGESNDVKLEIPLDLFGAFRAELREKTGGPVMAEMVFTRMRSFKNAEHRAQSPACGHY
ncbi:MAG: hypothetical protein JXN60_03485, partial [Lentisphaerae bacterium]|nr:hypothetical protein [Lentisphaerota bacterium]